jgi:hypothetical protein
MCVFIAVEANQAFLVKDIVHRGKVLATFGLCRASATAWCGRGRICYWRIILACIATIQSFVRYQLSGRL